MGCFDSVFAQCPSCGAEVEFQSKEGDCLLDRYTLEDAPREILDDLLGRKSAGKCKACGVALCICVTVAIAPAEGAADA